VLPPHPDSEVVGREMMGELPRMLRRVEILREKKYLVI